MIEIPKEPLSCSDLCSNPEFLEGLEKILGVEVQMLFGAGVMPSVSWKAEIRTLQDNGFSHEDAQGLLMLKQGLRLQNIHQVIEYLRLKKDDNENGTNDAAEMLQRIQSQGVEDEVSGHTLT